jgi:hypothetical protein
MFDTADGVITGKFGLIKLFSMLDRSNATRPKTRSPALK